MVILAGCSQLSNPFQREPEAQAPDPDTVRPVERPAAPATDVGALGGVGQSAEALDTTTEAERAAATAPDTGGAALGQTVASLGDPTEPGFWLKTPLVQSETPGRVETAGGASVQVTLIPIEGADTAGSRLSLAAMRALGLGLTDLPTVSVFRG